MRSIPHSILLALALLPAVSLPIAAQGSCANPNAWFVSGTVTGGPGIPLAGVNIDVLDGLGASLALSQDFTLADGSFELFICDPIAIGLYTLVFSPPPGSSYFPEQLAGVFLTPPGVALPTVVELERGSRVLGVVVDEASVGIEEVDLQFIDPVSGVLVPFSGDVTGPDGSFSVLVTSGTWDVVFRETLATSPAGPYVPELLGDLPLPADVSLGTIVLRDAIPLSGTIRGPGAQPLAGADVDVRDPLTGAEVLILGGADTSGLDGGFTVPVPQGSWELEIEPPSGVPLVAQLVLADVAPPGPVSVGVVTLPAGFAVSGTTRTQGGAAVPAVDLDFIVAATGVEIATANDNADSAGNFSVLVVPGTYDIQFKPPFPTGLAPVQIDSVVVASSIALGIVTLPPGRALTGTVTDGGAPVADAAVTLSSGGQPVVVFGNRTGFFGDFALRQVPGIYDVTVTPPPGGGNAITVPGVDLTQDLVLDIDLAAATPPPGVSSLVCSPSGSTASLGWVNGATDYDSIEILRNGSPIATLPGSAVSHLDPSLADDAYSYAVRPVRDGLTGTASSCVVVIGAPPQVPFIRGDGNLDGSVNISDAISILDRLFGSSPPSTCPDAADSNDDGTVNIADPIHLLAYLFSGGPPPSAPFPAAGPDSTADPLPCL